MNKIKIVSLVAVVAAVVVTGFLWTSEKPFFIQQIEERYNPKDFYIQFYDEIFPVRGKVFKQFKVQKTEKEFFQKKLEGKLEQEKLIEKIKEFPSETASGKVVGAMAKKFLGMKTWNITKHIEDLIPKKHLDEAKGFIAKTIKLLLDIASGKLDPKEVTHSNTLFMIIKIADRLGNDHVMRLCAGPLMQKITGITEIGPTHCFEGHTAYIDELVLLSDGKRALSSSYDGTICLWDFKKKEKIRDFTTPYKVAIVSVLVLPGDKQFLALEEHGIVRLFDIETGKLVRSFVDDDRFLSRIILFKDGKHFISVLPRRDVKLWNINKKDVIRTFHGRVLKGAVPLDNERFILYGSILELLRVDQEDPVRTFGLEQGETVDEIFNLGDGRFISTGSRTILWNIDSRDLVYDFRLDNIERIFPLGRGRYILSRNRMMVLCTINHQRVSIDHTFELRERENVRGIVVLPNGQFISYGDRMRLWDIDEKREVRVFNAESISKVFCLTGCKRLLSFSFNSRELLDFKTGKRIFSFHSGFERASMPYGYFVLPGNKQFGFLLKHPRSMICLFDIDPFENLSFEQIELCYDFFEKKIKMSLEVISKNIDTIKSLPKFLKDEIVKRKSFTGDDDEEEEGEVE